MKVAVRCESLLLQRSLEIFLHDRLSSIRQCDVVIRDRTVEEDPYTTLLIGSSKEADLVKPFSRSQLVMMIEKIGAVSEPIELPRGEKSPKRVKSLSELEERIGRLTQAYQAQLMQTIREYYEK